MGPENTGQGFPGDSLRPMPRHTPAFPSLHQRCVLAAGLRKAPNVWLVSPSCGWSHRHAPHVSLPSEYKNRCSEKGPAWKAQERVGLREMGPFPQTGAGAEQVWLGRWARAGSREHKTMRPRPEVQEREEEEAAWGGGKESKEKVCVATWPPGRIMYSLTANLESWKHSATSS